jgi:hypothetical protein
MMIRAGLAILFSFVTWPSSLTAQVVDSEEAAVIEAVETGLAALGQRDTATLRALNIPPAIAVVSGFRSGEAFYRGRGLDGMIEELAADTVEMTERIWSPEVRVRGTIATLWAPYDFYVGKDLSHCGFDAFQLVRSPEGWKWAAVTYTYEQPPDCELHPDGPPHGP